MKHTHDKTYAPSRVTKDEVLMQKRKQEQQQLPQVKWGGKPTTNCWGFKYLGSDFDTDGGQMGDITSKIVMVTV